MFFFITACIKLFSFISNSIYREFMYIFWIDRKYEKEVCDRGAAYVHQLIRNMYEDGKNQIDPIRLKEKFIGFEAYLASIKIDGEVEFSHGIISGLDSLKIAHSCSLTENDNLMHVNASTMAGPLSFDFWVTVRFLGFEQKFFVKGNLSFVKFLCKFTVTPKEDKNGLFECLFIRELKGIKLWIQEGPWLLKWHVNLGITLVISLLKPFIRNAVEGLLEYCIKDSFSKYKFPVDGCGEISPSSKSSDSSRLSLSDSDSSKSSSSKVESDAQNKLEMKSKPILQRLSSKPSGQSQDVVTARNVAQLRKSLSLEAQNGVIAGNKLKNPKFLMMANGPNSAICDKDKKRYETAATRFNGTNDETGKLQNGTNGRSASNGLSMSKKRCLNESVPNCDRNRKAFITATSQFIEQHDETRKLWAKVQSQRKNEANGPSITNGMNKKNVENTRIKFMERHNEVNNLWEEVKLASQAMELDSDKICRNDKENVITMEFLRLLKDEGVNACPYSNVCPYKNPTTKGFVDGLSVLEAKGCVSELERNEDYQTTSSDKISAPDNFNAKNVKIPQKEFEGSDTLRNFFNNSLTVVNESATYNNIATLDNEILKKRENIEPKKKNETLEREKATTASSLKRCSETSLLQHSPKSRKRFSGSSMTSKENKYDFLEMDMQSSKQANREEIRKDAKDLWSLNKPGKDYQVLNHDATIRDLLSYSAMMPRCRSSICSDEKYLASDKSEKENLLLTNAQDVCVESYQLGSCEDQFVDMLLYTSMMPKSRSLTYEVSEKYPVSNESENNKTVLLRNDEECEEGYQQSACENTFVETMQYSSMMPTSRHSNYLAEIQIAEPYKIGNEPNIIERTENGCLESVEFSSLCKDPFAYLLAYSSMIPKSRRSFHVEASKTKVEPVAQAQSEATERGTSKNIIEGDGNCFSTTMGNTTTTCDSEVSSKENGVQENQPNAKGTNTNGIQIEMPQMLIECDTITRVEDSGDYLLLTSNEVATSADEVLNREEYLKEILHKKGTFEFESNKDEFHGKTSEFNGQFVEADFEILEESKEMDRDAKISPELDEGLNSEFEILSSE